MSLHFTTLHYPLIWLNPIKISYSSISLHFTSLHFTSLHCNFRGFSPHFYSFHSIPFVIAFLTLFLKVLGLQRKVPNPSTGSWFQFLMVLFTKEYFLISVLCFLSLTFQTWSTLLKQKGLRILSCITFQAHSPEHTLKSAHKRAIVLRWAKVSQSESFFWLVNGAAFFCTRSNAFICPSLHWSQHAHAYSRTGRTNDVWAKLFVFLFPFLRTRNTKWSAFQAFSFL